MKKLVSLILTALLYGCGGSDSASPVNTVSITDNAIAKYIGGEELNYKFSYYSIYTDGSGEVSTNGSETVYIYSGYTFNGITYPNNKHVTVIDSGSLSSSTNDYYFYDDANNYIHYLTGNDNYYTNQDLPASGSLIMPNTINVGSSWTNNPLTIVYDDSTYTGSITYTVIKKEFVNVPYGSIESFKINYSSSFSGLTIDGTIWVHPKIGIIKNIQNVNKPIFFDSFNSTSTTELVNINWAIE